MDDKRMTIILRKRASDAYEHTVKVVGELIVPDGYHVDTVTVEGEGNLAQAYNLAMRRSDAKYKLYFKQDVVALKSNLLKRVLTYFKQCFPIGIMGLWGSEIPLDGDYTKSRNRYGVHWFCDNGESMSEMCCQKARSPLFYQEIPMLDAAFLATCVDVEWDECMGDNFVAVAQCCRMRQLGFRAIVVEQKQDGKPDWAVFREANDYENPQQKRGTFEKERIRFLESYTKNICPLVSILIPTYNQPEYFRQALESALAQDYPNFEIVVGDDSTDDRTKKLIFPYLQRYPEIRYYHHGGPLGGKGIVNIRFLLEKSKGVYINYLLHDDLFYPGKICRMMGHFIRDFDEEIGMVSSRRALIDSEGNQEEILPWEQEEHRFFSGYDAGRKLLLEKVNYLGELTTVLAPKKMFYIPWLNSYRNGYYFGFSDRFLGDVSTWLAILGRGKRCVFLKEPLSAFRIHSGQNTEDLLIRVGGYLSWMALVVLSWLHGIFLRSEDECMVLCREFCDVMREYCFPEGIKGDSNDTNEDLMLCQALLYARDASDDEKLFHLIFSYILVHSVCPEKTKTLCVYDEHTGYWRKRL